MKKLIQLFTQVIVNRDRNFLDKDLENRFQNYSVFCAAGLPTMLIFGCASLFKGQMVLSFIIIACYAGLTYGWYLLYRCVAGQVVFRFNSLLYCMLLLVMAYIGGTEGSKLLWSYTFPLAAFFLLGMKEGAVWCSLLFLAIQFIFFAPSTMAGVHVYPFETIIRFNLSFIFVSTITFFFEHFRNRYRGELEDYNRKLTSEIRERQEFERALTKSEAQYRAVFNQAAEGIILINSSGTIIESNPQMEHALGMPVTDLISANIFTIIHPTDLETTPSQIPQMMQGDIIVVERRMRTVDGAYRLFEVSGSKLDDDLILLLCRDITERKEAELALEKANAELGKLANIDGLTQIANRRRFDETLNNEWERLQRDGAPITLILADIDCFKQYNDLYGHQEGDSCLITIARTIRETLRRPADLAARFGGEEFAIILPNTPIDGGLNRAEEMRRRITSLRVPHNGSTVGPYVSMSFGVSSMIPSEQEIPGDLIAMADKALYQAKNDGRNQVVVSDEFIM